MSLGALTLAIGTKDVRHARGCCQESNQGSSGVLTLAIGTKDVRHARGCWRRTLELRPQLGRVEARFHSEPRERRQKLQHG